MENPLSALSLDADASTDEIRNAYLKLTTNSKFNKILLEDPAAKNEFISVYKAYVTLMRHRSASDSVKHLDYYPPDKVFQLIFNQGVYLALTQQWIKAGEKLQEAFLLNKNHSLLQTYLGQILLFRKNEYAAEKYLVRAIDLNPNNSDAWLLLGDVYFQTGNLKKAKSMYKSAQDLSVSNQHIQKRLVAIKQKELSKEKSQTKIIDKIKKLFRVKL